MNISNADLQSEWEHDLEHLLQESEEAEKRLSYSPRCISEDTRRMSGSYYTPKDVAMFFWDEFFLVNKIKGSIKATNFINHNQFIEPSVGSGTMVFSLFLKMIKNGVRPSDIASMDLTLVDINPDAIDFVTKKIDRLFNRWNGNHKIKFVCQDFKKISLKDTGKPYLFFGNPPYVNIGKDMSKWRNLFADFVDISLEKMRDNGGMHFILPLSFSFSKHYVDLRKKISTYNRKIVISHFDNIPDSLFKYGKPKHKNTNKANSQRCSICTIIPDKKTGIHSTGLVSWQKHERKSILSRSPVYHDVTKYGFCNQIPRPANKTILKYMKRSIGGPLLKNLLSPNGRHILYVGSVARNYIGIREKPSPGVHKLYFEKKDNFYMAVMILASDLFFDYWKTLGDGFHVTQGNILSFPLNARLAPHLAEAIPDIKKLWQERNKYKKTKINSGHRVNSYDLSRGMPSVSRLYNSLS